MVVNPATAALVGNIIARARPVGQVAMSYARTAGERGLRAAAGSWQSLSSYVRANPGSAALIGASVVSAGVSVSDLLDGVDESTLDEVGQGIVSAIRAAAGRAADTMTPGVIAFTDRASDRFAHEELPFIQRTRKYQALHTWLTRTFRLGNASPAQLREFHVNLQLFMGLDSAAFAEYLSANSLDTRS